MQWRSGGGEERSITHGVGLSTCVRYTSASKIYLQVRVGHTPTRIGRTETRLVAMERGET
jgi:hypothetical protein